MLERALVVEYWQDSDGRYFAESRAYPIAATGESLSLLKQDLVQRIRDCFAPGLVPTVYDLVPRGATSTLAARSNGAALPAGPDRVSS